MSSDILLLAVLGGLTLIGYMIAINAHGPIRLGLSYFLATILLAGTVLVIVQHVNQGYDSQEMEKFKKLEMEKKQVEERVVFQEEALKTNKERMNFAAKLTTVIASGTVLSSMLISIDLQDRTADLETLVAKANGTQSKISALKKDFESLSSADNFFVEPIALIKDGIQLLGEAAQYFRQYYYSEDADQENLRERIMRQKARNASEKFQKAGALIASQG
jgi:hypothetical protein